MRLWFGGLLAAIGVAAVLGGGATSASAQNVICSTAPPGTSDNRCASTAFVHGAIPVFGTMALQNANNVAITGGSITGLSALGATGDALFKDGRPWADVRAWGAAGDGSTDDTTAVQNAANFLTTTYGGGTLYFSSGNPYCLKTGVTTTGAIRALGTSTLASAISACGSDITPLTLNGAYSSVEWMTIIGKGANNDTGTFGATKSALVLGTSCVNCRIMYSLIQGGLHAIELHTGDIYLQDIFPSEAYGSAVVYSDAGANFYMRTKIDQSWPVSIPPFGTTINAWAASTPYTTGTVVSLSGYLIQATNNGTSASGAGPALKNYFVNITDGSVTWLLVGATTYYGLQFDTGSNENVVDQGDFSGSYTAGIAFTNTKSGAAPRLNKITNTVIGQTTNEGILASAGSGLAISGLEDGGGIVAGSTAIGFFDNWAGDVTITNSLIFGASYGIFISGNSSNTSITNNLVFGSAIACIHVQPGISNFSIVGNIAGASGASGACAIGIDITTGASDFYNITGNVTQGATTGINDHGTGTNKNVSGNDGPVIAGLVVGTSIIGSGTSNGLLYDNGGVLGNLATANNGVLVTSAGGVPSISSTLPSGLTAPSLTVTSAFTATGLVTLADHATQATNTVIANATSGTASPTALAVGSCSTAASALIWTTNTGFGCNTSITAAAVPASGLTGTTLAASVVTSSLTTVGTIGAGTWQGTIVSPTFGGTGINNGAKTITLGASLTTTGAGAATLAFPASTAAFTLPGATDTLGGLGATQVWTGRNTHTVASTIASGTSATLDDISSQAATTTVTGTTAITTAAGFNKVSLYRPTITDASAVAISKASTLYIDNAPLAAGSATITNPYALSTGAGDVLYSGANEAGTLTDGQSIARNALVGIQRVVTSLGAANYGLYVDTQNNNATASQASFGIGVTASVPSGNSTAQSTLRAFNSTTFYAGTGGLNIGGPIFNSQNSGTGTITTLAGAFYILNNSISGGTVTLGDGIQISTPAGSSSGTVTWTNLNGMEIQDQKPSGAGTSTLTNPPAAILIDSQTATSAFAINQLGLGVVQFASAVINMTALPTDTAQTDNTVCVNGSGKLFKGSGTLGICLGTSSGRFKERIKTETDGLQALLNLSPKTYFYRSGYGDGGAREQYGFLAEDVVSVLPTLVGLDDRGRPNTVDLVGMIPVMVRAIQELKASNDNLRAELHRAGAL